MNTMQIFASELSKFEWSDKAQTVLVAGADIVGIEIAEVTETDVKSLVGAGAGSQEPTKVAEGSKWMLREERPLVESANGGTFAFLVPVL